VVLNGGNIAPRWVMKEYSSGGELILNDGGSGEQGLSRTISMY